MDTRPCDYYLIMTQPCTRPLVNAARPLRLSCCLYKQHTNRNAHKNMPNQQLERIVSYDWRVVWRRWAFTLRLGLSLPPDGGCQLIFRVWVRYIEWATGWVVVWERMVVYICECMKGLRMGPLSRLQQTNNQGPFVDPPLLIYWGLSNKISSLWLNIGGFTKTRLLN